MYRWLAIAAGVVAVGFFVLFRATRQPTPPTPRSGYVNPAVCAGCHEGIAKTYRLTGMGRSFYRPRPENTVEDYKTRNTLYHAASDRYYTMTLHDGKPFQRRRQTGYDGRPGNIVEKAADYVIGSGSHARSYLHRTGEGKLLQLPVTWYSENGGYWAMSPGYDRANHQDFRRAIGVNCMFCHNGYPENPESYSVFSEPVFSDPIPEGIDCQRCHGPGRQHAEAAGSGRATLEAIRSAIVNPTRLSRDRQLEICMQCHLETTSSPLPNMMFRHGRSPFSYRPGEPLADSFLFFDHAPGTGHDDKFEIAHAAYRLCKSACFQASAMTCGTCHNPHDIPRGTAAIEHYTSKCRSCHSAAHNKAQAGNCMDCHMPRRRAEDAVHVVMTDHYIQRRPAGNLLAPKRETHDSAYRGEVVLYYPPQPAQTAEQELHLAAAQVRDESNLTAGIPRLRAALKRHKPAAPDFYFDLGKAYLRASTPKEAIPYLEESLRRQPGFQPAAKELASALIASGDLLRAAEVLRSARQDAAVLTNLGNVLLRQGEVERAVEALTQALSLNPDEPDAHNLLGMAWSQKGDRAAAERHFRNAIAAQPDLAAAHHNLGNLLASAGDYRQGAWHFEKAIALNPAYAEAHYRYALTLLALKSYDKALGELRQAARLAPDRAEVRNDLADVLAAKGDLADAADEYRAAIRLKPDLFEAEYGLGSVLTAAGKAAEARPHFQRAAQSGDSAIRQGASKALGRLR